MNWSAIVPVGAACIAAAAAVLVGWRNAKALEHTRKLTRELKIAEFRQAWINDLRDAMITVGSFSRDNRPDEGDYLQAVVRLQLMMNPKDALYTPLMNAAESLYDELEIQNKAISTGDKVERSDDDKLITAIKTYKDVSQAILKEEWERLKKDIKACQ